MLIDGVLFHDVTRSCNTASHIECLFVQGASYVTIRNSKFRNCDVMDMFFHSINGATPPDNVVIENNWFDDPGGNSIMFRSDSGQVLTNCTLRYNSFLSAFFAEGPGTWTNFNVVGNISPMNPWGCVGGLNYSHNVFSNTTCGASDKQAAPGFVNAGAFDLHLAAGSAAVNAGDPATTGRGHRRPVVPDGRHARRGRRRRGLDRFRSGFAGALKPGEPSASACS